MSDKTYNGWTNYETWCVNLWLTNDQGSDEMARELCRPVEDYQAAKRLKEFVDEIRPDLGASMFTDLLGAALSEVNWIEIARAFKEDDQDQDDAN